MLTIVCGKDTVSSRKYIAEIKSKFEKEQSLITEIKSNQIFELKKGLFEEQSLFKATNVFFVENLNKEIGRSKKNDLLTKTLTEISNSKKIILYDWEEDKSAWELKIKKYGILKEFKPNQTIFKLLDSCFPDNLVNFNIILENLLESENQEFVFIMLVRHIRILILALSSSLPLNTPPWQKAKIYSQAKFWKIENLIKFYEGLHRIDISIKTNSLPYKIKGSLDILACYFL